MSFMWKRLLVLVVVLTSCAGSADDPYDIILISIDTIRADRLGCYGYFRNTSPNLDAFAREATIFDRCLSPMATTLPAHLSLMTATYPDEHSVLANARDAGRRFVPNPLLRTFAELAGEQGYATAAFVSATPVKSHSGLQAGFQVFDESDEAERRAGETNRAVFQWLKKPLQDPRFLWVHYFDPHTTYDPPAPYDTLFSEEPPLYRYLSERRFYKGEIIQSADTLNTVAITNRYDGEVRYLDEHIGELFDELRASGRWDRTVVIVAGDHGEGLGQHGEMHHGSIWHEQLQVPLIIKFPGRDSGRDATLLSLVDVFPMVTAAVDWNGREALFAQTSSRAWKREANSYVMGQSSAAGNPGARASDMYSLTGARWKFVWRGGESEQLFDLQRDPFELEDVARSHPDTVKMLQAKLHAQINSRDRNSERFWSERPPRPDLLSPETVQELRSLGYLH